MNDVIDRVIASVFNKKLPIFSLVEVKWANAHITEVIEEYAFYQAPYIGGKVYKLEKTTIHNENAEAVGQWAWEMYCASM